MNNNLTDQSSIPVQEEETAIDLRQYLGLVLHWWWLIVLAGVLAGGAAYLISQRMTPIYQSSTTLLINEALTSRATDYNSLLTSERLAKTYAEMMTKRPVLEEVARRLSLSYSADELGKMISVTPMRDTQLLSVTVESADPQLAPQVANTLVAVFIQQLAESQSSRFAASKESLQKQIADSEAQIAQIREQMDSKSNPDELARLETRLNQYEQINADLVVSYEQIRTTEAQSASNVEQIEMAVASPVPVSPNVMQNTLLAAVVGVMLAVGGIFLFDMLDDTVKTPDDIRRKLNLPILGAIPRFKGPEEGWLVAHAQPRSPVTESFRELRVNVQYSSVDEPLRTLMVTSPMPSDGKTTVVSNLAVVMSIAGKRITVMDGDLHRPRLHAKFSAHFQPGLSSLFLSSLAQLNGHFQETPVDGVHLVSAGELPPNPGELLGSKRMQKILEKVMERSDMVIIDTPPVLSVTDAMVLAPLVDGVLLVVKPGKTKISMLENMVEQLRYVGARVIGVVINEVDERNPHYGYYYKNYYHKTYKYYGREARSDKRMSHWGRGAKEQLGGQRSEAEHFHMDD